LALSLSSRYHLKSIFSKTGTSHQAQLVSLLARFTDHF
jgi:DNA-binding CsgD family transcriptional regulator